MKLLIENSYHLLGLDILSNQKSIIKRGKELIGMLKIGEHTAYPLDINGTDEFRTEDLVKKAQEKLLNPQKKVVEFFFWFCNNDDFDQKALSKIESNDSLSAIEIWQNAIDKHPDNSLIYKKNLVVIYLILLANDGEKKYLNPVINLLYELANDKWKQFCSVYKLHDEHNTGASTLDEVKKDIQEWMADFFTSLSQEYNDQDFIVEFQKVFGLNVGKINSEVVLPISEAIHRYITELKSLDISEDGFFDQSEAIHLKKIIEGAQDELNRVIDVNLYGHYEITKLRNEFASALRDVSLDLHNNLSDIETSQKLLEISKEIGESHSLIEKIDNDLIVVNEGVNEKNLIELSEDLQNLDLIVKRDSISYKGKKIYYKDVTGVAYHTLRSSTYFVPTNQSYEFKVKTDNDEVNVSFSSFLMMGNDERMDLFSQLINATHIFIENLVIKKIMHQIFDQKKRLEIGSVTFSHEGFYRKKFWGNELETVLWTDTVYKAHFESGNVCLLKDRDGAPEIFETIPLSTYNSVFIPKLIEESVLMV